MPEAFVLAQLRTPRGKGSAKGALAAIAPGELVRQLLVTLVARGVEADAVDDVVLVARRSSTPRVATWRGPRRSRRGWARAPAAR